MTQIITLCWSGFNIMNDKWKKKNQGNKMSSRAVSSHWQLGTQKSLPWQGLPTNTNLSSPRLLLQNKFTHLLCAFSCLSIEWKVMFQCRLYVWFANKPPSTKINHSPLWCNNINTYTCSSFNRAILMLYQVYWVIYLLSKETLNCYNFNVGYFSHS